LMQTKPYISTKELSQVFQKVILSNRRFAQSPQLIINSQSIFVPYFRNIIAGKIKLAYKNV